MRKLNFFSVCFDFVFFLQSKINHTRNQESKNAQPLHAEEVMILFTLNWHTNISRESFDAYPKKQGLLRQSCCQKHKTTGKSNIAILRIQKL